MREADDGFTLIEVLVALVVFSVAIIGLTHAGTESTRNVFHLESKSWAGIVADNQLISARRGVIELGERSGREEQMGLPFEWSLTTSPTDTPDLFRLDVDVFQEGNSQLLIRRTSFRSRSEGAGL